ncbi:uncharacterized protein [Ptychodera flava]|uniref:uncharacterized protein n=1 Tax=Ptychodera flava TaxID=63121 RepID=UPI00396A173E
MIRMQSRGDDLTMTLLLLRYFYNGMIQAAVQDVKKQRDDRVYIFQIYESCSCPFFYLEDGGGMKGLAIDVIEEVCRVAGKVCKFKLIYFTECLINDAEGKLMAGKGLFGRNFDACVGFSRNKEFENILSMSDSIWKYGGESQFFVKTGNPRNFDPRNITGKKIIFINSWQSTIRCLVEHKVTGADSLMPSQLVFLNGTQQLMDQFDKHKADAVFGLELVVGKGEDVQLELLGGTPKGLEPIGDVIHCAEGVTISSRKDSSVTEWFNDGLRKIKKSGKYAKICREAEIKHGKMGQVDCEL